MFDSLAERLTGALRTVSGRGRLTEDNIRDAVRQVRIALLEADVALSVVRSFTADVQKRAVGREVLASLDSGQAFVKVVHEELVHLMGDANDALNLAATPPAVVLMAGLQGAGKTATVAKLARYLKERERRKVAVVSADVYRPRCHRPVADAGRRGWCPFRAKHVRRTAGCDCRARRGRREDPVRRRAHRRHGADVSPSTSR